jgi:hypothetical protein
MNVRAIVLYESSFFILVRGVRPRLNLGSPFYVLHFRVVRERPDKRDSPRGAPGAGAERCTVHRSLLIAGAPHSAQLRRPMPPFAVQFLPFTA